MPQSGFDGLEIWNYTSYWRGRVTSIPRNGLGFSLIVGAVDRAAKAGFLG